MTHSLTEERFGHTWGQDLPHSPELRHWAARCCYGYPNASANATQRFVFAVIFLLMLAGDIETNPGPRKPKYPCGICSAAVRQRDPTVYCDRCWMGIHNKCSGLSTHMFELMKIKNPSDVWICPSCGFPSFSSSLFSSSVTNPTSNSICILDTTDNNPMPFISACSSSPIKPNSVWTHGSKQNQGFINKC